MSDKSVVKQLEELLEPIKKDLGAINIKLDQHTKKLDQHQENFDGINKKLDQHTEALVNIEDTIKIYGDMYEINNGNVRKLEKRINVLENREEIVPPPELRLADL